MKLTSGFDDQRSCRACSKLFIPKRSDHVYCSKGCYRSFYYATHQPQLIEYRRRWQIKSGKTKQREYYYRNIDKMRERARVQAQKYRDLARAARLIIEGARS